MVLDAEGRYLKIAPTNTLNLTKPPEKLLGKKIHDNLPKEDADKILRQIQQSLAMRQMINFERKLKIGAREVWFDCTISPLTTDTVVWIRRDMTALKHKESELRKQKEILQMIFNNLPLMISFADQKGRITTVNGEWERILGWTLEEIKQQGLDIIAELYPDPHYRQQALNFITEAKGEWTDFKIRVRDGRFIDTVWAIIRLSDGTSLGLGQDITAHKETEEAFKSLVNHAPIGIYIIQEGKFVLLNPGFEKITGYRVGELINKGYLSIVAPEFQEVVRQKAIRMLNGSHLEPYEYQFINKQRERKWVMETVTPTEYKGKRAILGYFMDIDQRRQIEAALERLHIQHELILNAAGEGILGLDPQKKVTFVNAAAARKLGYEPPNLLGQDIHHLAHHTKPDGTPNPKENCPVYATLQDGESRRVLEDVFWTKDGRAFWVEHVTTPLVENGELTGGVNVFRDISERKELEKKLLQAQKMEVVGRLTGGVAHDFNNMLGVILGYTEVALMETAPEHPVHRNLDEVRAAAQRSVDLVRQLLAFARKQVVSPKVINLNEAISAMRKMLQRLIGEDINLAWMPGQDLWNIMIDPTQIDQLLANLMVNARDAIAGVGKVAIETANFVLDKIICTDNPECVPGKYVLLAVSDDGCGMDQETLANIFEPFFTTKDPGKGTGLGLSTVYGIVRQNHGFIKVFSNPGQGTAFKIYLPRFQREAAGAPGKMEEAALRGGAETVLVVEDEEMMLNLGKMLLERLGYKVLVAKAPTEAIRFVREYSGEIDLLIADMVLPEMNGWELAERLKLIKPRVKCLYMSGYSADMIAQRGIMVNDLCFIKKPFSVEELAEKVRQALEQESSKNGLC